MDYAGSACRNNSLHIVRLDTEDSLGNVQDFQFFLRHTVELEEDSDGVCC